MRNQSRTTTAKADGFRRLEVITGVGRRRHWTAEDKARVVAESLAPATTASAVARRYGLHASQLFVWRQQRRRRLGRWPAPPQRAAHQRHADPLPRARRSAE